MKKSILIICIMILASCASDRQRIEELESRIEQYEQSEAENNRMATEFADNLEKFNNMQDSLRFYEQMVDSLKTEIKNKRRATPSDNAALAAMINQIDNFLSKNKELGETIKAKDFKGKSQTQIVNMLLKNLDDKEKQIAMMKEDIERLNKEVAGLKVENRNLTNKLDDANTAIASQAETIADQSDKIEKAKSLSLSNLRVDFAKGMLGKDKAGKKLETIDFCFAVNYNELITDSRNVTIYVRVTDAAGNVLDSSNGKLFNSESGQIGYTVKKDVYYQGKTINDRITWNFTKGTLSKGRYIATYYIDSHKADQKTFDLN
ncbi:MAG: hypothetical protein K5685_12335 [Bacteroidales bacterium]|nr:hypothetical protein [Bacteroidales bacterium]